MPYFEKNKFQKNMRGFNYCNEYGKIYLIYTEENKIAEDVFNGKR